MSLFVQRDTFTQKMRYNFRSRFLPRRECRNTNVGSAIKAQEVALMTLAYKGYPSAGKVPVRNSALVLLIKRRLPFKRRHCTKP